MCSVRAPSNRALPSATDFWACARLDRSAGVRPGWSGWDIADGPLGRAVTSPACSTCPTPSRRCPRGAASPSACAGEGGRWGSALPDDGDAHRNRQAEADGRRDAARGDLGARQRFRPRPGLMMSQANSWRCNSRTRGWGWRPLRTIRPLQRRRLPVRRRRADREMSWPAMPSTPSRVGSAQ
jgi:hypothetical protein